MLVCTACKKVFSVDKKLPTGTLVICPHCGHRMTIPKPSHKSAWTLLLVLLLAFLGFSLAAVWCDNQPPPAITPTHATRENVTNSAWDGSVFQVKRYLRRIIADPNAKFTEWSPVVKTQPGYMVRTRVRARNVFGGYVITEFWVWLDDDGQVLRHVAK